MLLDGMMRNDMAFELKEGSEVQSSLPALPEF